MIIELLKAPMTEGEYRSPKTKVIEVAIIDLLCLSGTVGEQDDPTEVDRD